MPEANSNMRRVIPSHRVCKRSRMPLSAVPMKGTNKMGIAPPNVTRSQLKFVGLNSSLCPGVLHMGHIKG